MLALAAAVVGLERSLGHNASPSVCVPAVFARRATLVAKDWGFAVLPQEYIRLLFVHVEDTIQGSLWIISRAA